MSSTQLLVSWGSAVPANGKKSDIFATSVSVSLH
jgi:hypothetical protein